MSGNTFGKILELTTFGESHGEAIGGILDGVPAGLKLDFDLIQSKLDKRKPGFSTLTSQRKESDQVKFLSGIFDGYTTGTPIGFTILNEDSKSDDYKHLEHIFRPGHADFSYYSKYGIRDHRGGGRSSARETASRVVAGAIAEQILNHFGIEIFAFVAQAGELKFDPYEVEETQLKKRYEYSSRCPNDEFEKEYIDLIHKIKEKGDTIGGQITCQINGVPAGLGEPVFDKLHAELAKAIIGINACKAFAIGDGFEASQQFGSNYNDTFSILDEKISTLSNHSGGIQGGISNGMPIKFHAIFKPVSSIQVPQITLNKEGKEENFQVKGRHDPCVLPRAVPIVESMAALVIADHYLRNRNSKL